MTIDTGKMWEILEMSLVVTLVVLLITIIVVPKKVNGYYLANTEQSTSKTCAYVDLDWSSDWKAFCTDDITFAVETIKQLNSTIK